MIMSALLINLDLNIPIHPLHSNRDEKESVPSYMVVPGKSLLDELIFNFKGELQVLSIRTDVQIFKVHD